MRNVVNADHRSLSDAVIGDGRFLLIFTGLILLLSGLFVIVQSLTGHFLPHDVQYLGMDAKDLSRYNSGTITNFMFHDRISFGGSIMAVGLLYMWLAEFPLRQGHAWSWYVLLVSGIIGFGSFLTYLGYGYLDSWHGIASLLLLPFFVGGLVRSYKPSFRAGIKTVFQPREKLSLRTAYGLGVALLLFSAAGMFFAGLTIMGVGMTAVFVPQDLEYMDITICGIEVINSNLKPLIAHDRAAFGGGLATIGLIYFFIIRCAEPTISLWQILVLSLSIGFTTALGVHFYIGYTNFVHLLPAYLGAVISLAGLILTFKRMSQPRSYVLS